VGVSRWVDGLVGWLVSKLVVSLVIRLSAEGLGYVKFRDFPYPLNANAPFIRRYIIHEVVPNLTL
jgi:hypothetical protein